MPSAAGRLSSRALTANLRELASQAVDIDKAGNPITREMALADLIWKQALGWIEETRDDSGTLQQKKHAPVAWAQQFLYERLEGKPPPATPEVGNAIKARDKIDDLVKNRLNAVAAAMAARRQGPPTHTTRPRSHPASPSAAAGESIPATCPTVGNDSDRTSDGGVDRRGQEEWAGRDRSMGLS